MSNQDLDSAFQYHELTKHSYWSVRTSAHFLDWAIMPAPFKVYPDLEPIPLPRELTHSGVPALAAIAATGLEEKSESRVTLQQLGSLLYYSAGVTKTRSYAEHTMYFRAAACAGALYPVETYIVSNEVEGLAAGVYHFNPGDFSLRCLRVGDYREALARATGSEPQIARAPVTLVFSAITWRSSWKYRDRSYRYHFWDNGMILANALATAASYGWPARVVMGFVEAEINRLIAIDGERELALSLLPLNERDENPPASVPAKQLPELTFEVLPLSRSEEDYPSIIEMHRASSLSSASEVVAWREAAGRHQASTTTGTTIPLSPLPADQLPGDSIEEVIQRRGSTRRFARKAIPFKLLSVLLNRASRGFSADFSTPGSQLNDMYLIVNRVEGLEPGAYFYRREEAALELLKADDFSDRARYLALDQDLAGDASATIFFMADLKEALERLGNRGYRAVQMEAGIIGGKLYLGAYAVKRGATGLTFYDDDVTTFFSPHSDGKSCVLVVSIGVPGKKPVY
jgi:SagB-type dehydrogenase family enzyme